MQSQKLIGIPCPKIYGEIMSEPDFPYSKKPNKPKIGAPPPPTPSPDLPPGHPPNTPPLKTRLTTKRSSKKTKAPDATES